MPWSFSEKSAWISLCSTLFIFGYYFIQVSGFSDLDVDGQRTAVMGLLFKALVCIAIVESVFHGMLAATNRKAAQLGEDERDKLIALRANHYAYGVLSVGVMITLGRMLLLESFPQWSEHSSSLQIPFLTIHMLMLSFILAELVRFASQVLLYRRGA